MLKLNFYETQSTNTAKYRYVSFYPLCHSYLKGNYHSQALLKSSLLVSKRKPNQQTPQKIHTYEDNNSKIAIFHKMGTLSLYAKSQKI